MEVISPWTLYWILQLDSIKAAVVALAITTSLATLFLGVIGLDSSERERARGETMHRFAIRLAIVAVPLTLLTAFLPSSRTMAAVVLIPAIANNETIQREASDLYRLAKQAIERVAQVEPPKEKAE